MTTYTARNQASQAMGAAMESGRAFSWIKGKDVQQGVYRKLPQEVFQKYDMGGAK